MSVRVIAVPGSIPHVPFVKRQPQLFRRTLMSTHEITNREGLRDLLFHTEVHREEF